MKEKTSKDKMKESGLSKENDGFDRENV
jgi:hypothetical protein